MRRFLLLAAVLCQAQTPGTIRVSVNLVTVACSVSDRNGAPVNSLRREDFSLLDDGKPRDIQYFWQESDLPLTVGLIADVSGSEIGVIRKHREMITQFLAQVIGPRDRAFIVTVGREVKLLRDLTASIDDLRSGVNDNWVSHAPGRMRRGGAAPTLSRAAEAQPCGTASTRRRA
jgi:VWFA-related protein